MQSNLHVIQTVWNTPTFGNKHTLPYGHVLVSDGIDIRKCEIKYEGSYRYITFKRKRYGLVNKGTLYMPNLVIVDYEL